MKLFRRHILTIIALAVYWLSIFALTHIPISLPNLVLHLQASDKILHGTAYMILVFLLWFAINPNSKVNWGKTTVWWLLLVVIWYGAADEWLQGYVGRDTDIMDFLADLGGTVVALVLLNIFSFWTAGIIVTGGTIFIFANFTKVNPGDLLAVPNWIFHLLSYGFFTAMWMRWMYHFSSVKMPETRWFIRAVGLPLIFLILTDLFSFIAIRNVAALSAIFSAVGIVLAVFSAYLISRFRHRLTGRLLSQRP